MTLRRPPRRLIAVLAAGLALTLVGAGCGGGDNGGTTPAPDAGAVTVKDNFFDPKTVDVAVGDTVTWTFRGAVAHNVTGPGFTSKTMKSGTFTHTFTKAETVSYTCTIHTGMTGKVKVG
jgi:plastocyanin